MLSNRAIQAVWVVAVLALTGGCGGTPETGVAQKVDTLPKVTGPASSDDAANAVSLGTRATAGITLTGASSVNWSGKSRASCETLRAVRNVYAMAGYVDLQQCTIGKMEKYGVLAASVSDGNVHFYQMGGQNGASGIRYRIKIVKNADRIITFELAMCEGSTTYVQTGYMSQDLTNLDAVSQIAVNINTQGLDTFGSTVQVSGTFNGKWGRKTLEATTLSSFGGGASVYWEQATITQGATLLKLDLYEKGNYGPANFSTRVYAVAQVLGGDLLRTLALGDGSAHDIGTFNASNYDSNYSWNGDTGASVSPVSSGPYFARISAATPRAIGTQPTITFSSTQTWDCSAGTGPFETPDVGHSTDLSTYNTEALACGTDYTSSFNNYIDCSPAI